MRVLAVTHVLRLDELHVVGAREQAAIVRGQRIGALIDAAQVVGDHAVVGRGMFERLERQVETLGVGQATVFQVLEHARVVVGVDHDGDVLVVLGCRANHRRAADIDVLDGVRQGAARLGNGGRERVQVDRHQVDGPDAVFGHDRAVEITTAEDAAVDLRMQGLDPAIHHLRKTGVVGNFHCFHAVVTQQLEGAPGGKDLDAECCELTGKVDDTGLVGNADQCAANG